MSQTGNMSIGSLTINITPSAGSDAVNISYFNTNKTQGVQGVSGVQGIVGANGSLGANGPQGSTGVQGSILSGTVGVTGPQGAHGLQAPPPVGQVLVLTGAQQTVANTTKVPITALTVTGLTTSVQYAFQIVLFVNNIGTQGIAVSITGPGLSNVFTSISDVVVGYKAATRAWSGQAVAFNGGYGVATSGVTVVTITGAMILSSGSTFQTNFALPAGTGTVAVQTGSWIRVL